MEGCVLPMPFIPARALWKTHAWAKYVQTIKRSQPRDQNWSVNAGINLNFQLFFRNINLWIINNKFIHEMDQWFS